MSCTRFRLKEYCSTSDQPERIFFFLSVAEAGHRVRQFKNRALKTQVPMNAAWVTKHTHRHLLHRVEFKFWTFLR